MVLNGKLLADQICSDLAKRVAALRAADIYPELTIVTSGDNDASEVYVRNKVRRCEEIGISPTVINFDFLTDAGIKEYCRLDSPIIFQMPITGNVSSNELSTYFADPQFDMDGFISDKNICNLASGSKPLFYPCTPKGIVRLLDNYKIPLEGSCVCMIGRSNIVGRPLARMLEQRNSTVTLCHSKTPEEKLIELIKLSNIIISAVGQPNILTKKAVLKNGIDLSQKVLIDVGINRDCNGKLCGDFDRDIYELCKAYTPVPGGIGPMTIASLMENVVEFYERKLALNAIED